ncbi:MAG: DUF1292 domain-containing protein [Acholeplasmatales bacterium]|nr:DUF1292 domain-containing protein [Acholeplasmatales bacterium]
MQDRTITLTDDSGKTITAQILFTYHSDDLNKNYVVFLDTNTNQASAAEYFDDGNGSGHLGDIQSEDEWEMLNDLFEEYMENMSNNQKEGECCCGGNCGCDSGECGSEGCGSHCSCGDKENK